MRCGELTSDALGGGDSAGLGTLCVIHKRSNGLKIGRAIKMIFKCF
jgi:hypothetical protein